MKTFYGRNSPGKTELRRSQPFIASDLNRALETLRRWLTNSPPLAAYKREAVLAVLEHYLQAKSTRASAKRASLQNISMIQQSQKPATQPKPSTSSTKKRNKPMPQSFSLEKEKRPPPPIPPSDLDRCWTFFLDLKAGQLTLCSPILPTALVQTLEAFAHGPFTITITATTLTLQSSCSSPSSLKDFEYAAHGQTFLSSAT